MIQPSMIALFIPIILGRISGLNGGGLGGGYGRNLGPMSGNSGSSNMMPGIRPMTPSSPQVSPKPREIFPPRVPYTCTLFADSGYFCPSGYPRPSTQYYYDPFSQRCQTFYYRGCGGTPNRFSSRNACLRGCGCFSDIDFGNSCPYNTFIFFQQYTIRYAFNQYTGTCQSFRFSACNGGNDNNFRSQLECQTTCGPLSGSNNMNLPPYFPDNFAASSNSMNRMSQGTGSSNNIGSSSDMPTEGNSPSNTGSQTNFGTSSIIAMERSPFNLNSRVMGFPAFQNNFGSSALSAGNSAMNGRLSMMPSPLNLGTGPVMNLNGQIGNGMHNAALTGKRNKIY